MGLPVTGAWSRKYQATVPYTDARKWGTGINPVHAMRGGPGRPDNAKLMANQMGMEDRTQAHLGMSDDFVEYSAPWGYQPEDIAGLDVFTPQAITGIPIDDDASHPAWADSRDDNQTNNTPQFRNNIPQRMSRPWGAGRQFYEALRGLRAGQLDDDKWVSNQIPTETVSEGWVNKGKDGEVPDDNVTISSADQYVIQTSMVQRKKTLTNDRAMQRGTDDARTEVSSRIAPMKIKHYSEGERHYDMFPYQQDDIPRPFTYRTAGTGPASYLATNEQWLRTGLQRTPPPDPSMGTPDTELSETGQFGYAAEDQGYY